MINKDELIKLNVSEIKKIATEMNVEFNSKLKKEELIDLIVESKKVEEYLDKQREALQSAITTEEPIVKTISDFSEFNCLSVTYMHSCMHISPLLGIPNMILF